ncbi:imidazole glycerol phosphate synthase subunit HisF [Shewanella sp.]|uniref:imidazole glycerol phosphate synthase subunit HisF n=1 Tax=Shewanella sp. TaxID=50422 RepID=UPI0040480D78
MGNIRLIARLDIKGNNLIKGIHLEGLRVVGSPNAFALNYYRQGVDEIIYIDCVASLYGRNSLTSIVSAAAKDIFVPMTVGGGIRSVEDATEILRAGADKVAVNTAAVANPKLISDIARRFGSQCMVLSVEAKQVDHERWEVYTDNGRERTGIDVVTWVKKAVDNGAGEILLTSVDREGTRKGFDINLVRAVTGEVSVPLIASGGMGKSEDLIAVVKEGYADAVAMADVLHYERDSLANIRKFAEKAGLGVRKYE